MAQAAHPGALGLLSLVGALFTSAIGLGGIYLLADSIRSLVKGRRPSEKWSTTLVGLGALPIAVGLWYVAVQNLGAMGRLLATIGKVVFIILLCLAAVAATFGGVAIFVSDTVRERLFGVGSFLLAVILWAGVAVYFGGFDSLLAVPRFFSVLGSAAASAPLLVWIGTVIGCVILAFVVGGGLSLLVDAASSGGSKLDSSHHWADYKGRAYGRATRKEVYDHYHGRGSWYAMTRFWSLMSTAAGIAIPVAVPLIVVHLAGWYDIWSAGGAVLAVVLSVISLAVTILI